MQSVDLKISARHIIPVEPPGCVLEDHAVLVSEGRIADVVPEAEACARFDFRKSVDLGERVLIPGLINAHGHAAMTLFRGLADDLPLMDWLQGHIWPTEQRFIDADAVYDGTRIAIAEMIRGGTTCFNDMYFFPEAAAKAVREMGIRATLGLIVIEFPSAYAKDAAEYLEKGLALHDALRGNPLITAAFAPHAPYTVGDEALARIRILADELDLPIQMHVHETAQEVAESLAHHGKRPLARLHELGLLNPSLIAVHMTQLNDAEIELLATTGVHIAHCPESNLKLASGFCPVHRLMEAGVNVCLGTDGAASNNDLDMFGEMRLAALVAKAVASNASAVSAEQALRMATINGAKALGLEHKIGSIEPGKYADLVAVDLNCLESHPLYNLHSQLVYACARHQVSDVWVAGKRLLQDHSLTKADSAELLETAKRWGHKIRGESPGFQPSMEL